VRAVREGEAGPRWIALCTAATLGLVAITAVMTTYEWTHNLWWKWITPSVPLILLLAAYGALPLLSRLRPPAGAAIGVGLIAVTLIGYALETRRQQALSEVLYGTQVALVRWVEEAFPARTGVLCEGIPASYLRGRASSTPALLWTDPTLPHDDPERLGDWLIERRVGLVMWYREEWTGAPEGAGFLGDPVVHQLGRATLEPVADERSYGLIAYLVVTPGFEPPSAPVPEVAGRIER
jgi:hypothetical protein